MLLVCSPWSETNIHVFLQHQQQNRPSWISQNNFSEKKITRYLQDICLSYLLYLHEVLMKSGLLSVILCTHTNIQSAITKISNFLFICNLPFFIMYNTWPSVTVAVKLVHFNIKMILAELMSSFSCVPGRAD